MAQPRDLGLVLDLASADELVKVVREGEETGEARGTGGPLLLRLRPPFAQLPVAGAAVTARIGSPRRRVPASHGQEDCAFLEVPGTARNCLEVTGGAKNREPPTSVTRCPWPDAVVRYRRVRKGPDWDSAETKRLEELLAKEDPEALAGFILNTTTVFEDAGRYVRDCIVGPIFGTERIENVWTGKRRLRFLELMSADPRARERAGQWVAPRTPFGEDWCLGQIRERPDWYELAHVYLGYSDHDDDTGWNYERLRRLRELDSERFSLRVRLLARIRIVNYYAWSVPDLPAYWEETIDLINELERPGDRWRMLSELAEAAAHYDSHVFEKQLPAESLDRIGRILSAPFKMPEGEFLIYFSCGVMDLEGWPHKVARHLIGLAHAGRREEALSGYRRHFGKLPHWALERYLRQEGGHTPLRYENPFTHVERHAVRGVRPDELLGTMIRRGGVRFDVFENEIRRHSSGRDRTMACIRRFAESPLALARTMFDKPNDEETARELLRLVRELRKRSGNSRLFGRYVLYLCFRCGLLREAIEEAEAIEAEVPVDAHVPLVRAGALSLLGSGQAAWREILDRLGGGGDAYWTVVQCLKAARRYRAAQKMRLEAMEVYERLRERGAFAGKKKVPDQWSWLVGADRELVDNVAVKRKEEVSLPRTGDFRDDLHAAEALGLWKDYARIVAENFDEARDDEERFAWLRALLQWGRLREPCPPLKEWIDAHIAARKHVGTDIAKELHLEDKLDVDGLLHYASLWAKRSRWYAKDYAMRALRRAIEQRNEELCLRSYRVASDLHGGARWPAERILADFEDPPEKVAAVLDEFVLRQVDKALEKSKTPEKRYVAWVVKRAALRRRIDVLVKPLLSRPETAVAVWAAGWGGKEEDAFWRSAEVDPARLILGFKHKYMDYLQKKERWKDALAFLDLVERSSGDARAGGMRREDVLLKLGRRDEAVAEAARRGHYAWLIERGEEAAAEEAILRDAGATLYEPSFVFGPGPSVDDVDAMAALLALHVWQGRTDEATTHFIGFVRAYPSRSHSDATDRADRAWQFAFGPEHGSEWRETWKGSSEGREAALELAEELLRGQPVDCHVEAALLAGRCCIHVATRGPTKEERARAFKLLEGTFQRLGQVRNTRAAEWLCDRYRETGADQTAGSDPLREHLLTSVAAAEALGELFFERGFPLAPSYDGWDELPREERVRLLRRASRLLELRPLSEWPVWREPPFRAVRQDGERGDVPTPEEWSAQQSRTRGALRGD